MNVENTITPNCLLDGLDFVLSKSDETLEFWSTDHRWDEVAPNFWSDELEAVGVDRARQLVSYIERGGAPNILASVARAISESGKWTSAEVCFFYAIAVRTTR